MDPRFQHPFTAMISGPTNSGKTFFVTRVIEHLREMIFPIPEEIIWFYGEWQRSYSNIRGVTFIEGLQGIDRLDNRKRRLCIVDDLMDETDEKITKLFTKGSHHRSISIVYIVQNLFAKSKEHRTISLNSQYLVVFKNPRDAGQITHLA